MHGQMYGTRLWKKILESRKKLSFRICLVFNHHSIIIIQSQGSSVFPRSGPSGLSSGGKEHFEHLLLFSTPTYHAPFLQVLRGYVLHISQPPENSLFYNQLLIKQRAGGWEWSTKVMPLCKHTHTKAPPKTWKSCSIDWSCDLCLCRD